MRYARRKCSGPVVFHGTLSEPAGFYQNFSESFMLKDILAREPVLPAEDTVEPFVDADDIADVAVAAFAEPGHRNKVFEVTGLAR